MVLVAVNEQEHNKGISLFDSVDRKLIIPVGHKKCATILWTITSTFRGGFQQLMHHSEKQ